MKKITHRRGAESMSEAKDYIKDKYERNKQAASDPNVPISEAAKQAWNEAASDWAAISAYAQCRKQRKLDVSNRLKEVRKACGLRQQDVAEKTGINVITLSGYELARSEPNMEALVRLADVYHVTLDYLMCRTDTKE